MYVFGIDLPVVEVSVILAFLLLVLCIWFFYSMRQMSEKIDKILGEKKSIGRQIRGKKRKKK